MTPRRYAVVGAGIVGLAVARRILECTPDAQVTVLEKEDRVGAHQSSHNSGVIHAGLYYRPGSLKAELTRRGRHLLTEFCAAAAVPVVTCGKLVVALDAGELGALDEIERRARDNGVPIRRVEGAELRAIEPHAAGVAALHSPATAVVDYGRVAAALATDVSARGGSVLCGNAVSEIVRSFSAAGESVVLRSASTEVEVDRAVICAGLFSDRVAALAGAPADPAIVPFRGEYYRIVPERAHLVRALLYPVPDPRYPFLGVHFTRRIDGVVEVGPNAVLALKREGYAWRDIAWRDVGALLATRGFRRLARQHWRTAVRELSGSALRELYVAQARRYLPELRAADVARAGAGVRAQAVAADGSLLDDFAIQRVGPVVAVRNAPSPAATASLAIAEHIVAGALD